MRAGCLLLVFVIAKLLVLAQYSVPISWWSPIALFWQDILVAGIFGLVDAILQRPRIAWCIYAVLVGYAALNVAVERVLATPLTIAMLRATGGPLADSIRQYLTWQNIGFMTAIVLLAAAAPKIITRVPRLALFLALAAVLLGPTAGARVETLGLHRNAVAALVSFPVRPSVPSETPVSAESLRTPPFPASTSEQTLNALRSSVSGRNVILVSLESTAAYVPIGPALAELAQSGIIFENVYAVYPESIKGFYSVLCSRYPAIDSRAESYAGIGTSIAEVLRSAGYRTGLFHSGHFEYLGMEAIIRNRGFETLEDACDISGNRRSSFGVDEHATVSRLLSWIDTIPRGSPFFLSYMPVAGHHPYDTPERGPFPEHDIFGRYRNALLYGDASLGELREGLRRRGLDSNTLWIVYGDHGEAFGQHEGNYGHTFYIYEENVHVPLVIAAPGVWNKTTRVGNIISLLDLAPTVLDLLGISAPANYQGQSALHGTPRMALFFTDYSLKLAGLRDGRWKYMTELGSSRGKLVDLERDVSEQRDLSAIHRDRAEFYRDRLRHWIASHLP
jgi:arylsulfatase A-like enzyme